MCWYGLRSIQFESCGSRCELDHCDISDACCIDANFDLRHHSLCVASFCTVDLAEAAERRLHGATFRSAAAVWKREPWRCRSADPRRAGRRRWGATRGADRARLIATGFAADVTNAVGHLSVNAGVTYVFWNKFESPLPFGLPNPLVSGPLPLMRLSTFSELRRSLNVYSGYRRSSRPPRR